MTEMFLMAVMVSSVVSAVGVLLTVLMLKKPRMSANLVLLMAFSGAGLFGAVSAIIVGLSRGSEGGVVFGYLFMLVILLFSSFLLINDKSKVIGPIRLS